ncbi:MAG: lamin tail domain-containing protein [Melioribacteraceae bacterium]
MSNIKCISILFLICGISVFAQQTSPLTFSEIMFYPSESNGEFVEIYNTSLTDTVDLSGYKFKYYTSSNNNIVPFIGGTKLAPQKFAVIIQGNYDFNNGIYKTLIPPDAIVLKISSNNFGSSGMANTTSRTVYLINPAGQIVDTYTYSADNSAGISDEKIILNKDNSSSNWQNSIKTHGTPGFKNSASPTDYDLQIKLLKIEPLIPRAEDSLKITFAVFNKGRLTANNFSVSIFNDINHDSAAQSEENIFYQDYFELLSGDSVVIQKSIYIVEPGNYSFIANVNFINDEVKENNRVVVNVTAAEKLAFYNDVVINEIMYAPINDEPEWIELYNRSNRKINLKNWKIGDNSSSVVISANDIFIDSNQYLIISKDASINNFYNITSQLIIKLFPTLNNTGDEVILRDSEGRTVDSVKYNPSWGGSSGKSLERISADDNSLSSSNWGTSISKEKATPGKINSLTKKHYDVAIISVSVAQQLVYADQLLNVKAVIKNVGKESASNLLLKVYDDKEGNSIIDENNLIVTKYIELINPDIQIEIEIVIDSIKVGKNNFIFYLNYELDDFTDNNLFILSVNGIEVKENLYDVVINEIMYAPSGDEPEWIELFNRSDKIINLKNWKIGDNSTFTEITKNDFELNPYEYLVISGDSSITNIYPSIAKLIVCSLSILNNSGDAVIIKDIYNRTIDSLKYFSDWGGNGGKSLERKSADLSSILKENWSSSISKYKGTPGKINSISEKNYDLEVKSFYSKSNYAEINKSIKLSAIIKNNGIKKAENFSVNLYKKENLLQNIDIVELEPGREQEIEFDVDKIDLGNNQFVVNIIYQQDEFEENNEKVISLNGVKINEQRNDIVINEIMYAPISPEPEWIELYNRSEKEIDIKNYQIGNEESRSTIIKTSRVIKPKEYVVIAKDTNIYSIYSGLKNVVISNFPILNNNGGMIVISDSLGRVIDSVYYKSSWGGRNGKSLERIDVNTASEDSSNWKSALEFRGTPERKNSMAVADYDLAITYDGLSPSIPVIGDTIIIKFKIKNIGKLPAKNFSIQIFNDVQCDSILKEDELIQTMDYAFLNFNDSLIINYTTTASIIGENCLITKIIFSQDEKIFNNNIHLKYNVIEKSRKYNDVVINEIMYAPSGDEPEWIELFNRSDEIINLNNWKIGDKSSLTKIIARDYKLQPKEYLVITKDSSILNYYSFPFRLIKSFFPTLNNTGDAVVIKDLYDRTIDSVMYFPDWGGNNGKSLERKSVDSSSNEKYNWNSSISKFNATPGKVNSISQKDYDVAIESFLSKSKYAEAGKSLIISAVIKNSGKQRAENIEVRLYKDENLNNIIDEPIIEEKEISLIEVNQKLQIEFTISTVTLGINQFILSVNYSSDEDDENNIAYYEINGVKLNEERNDIVINEIMYAPISPEPEWIELYNRSEKEIDIKNYQIGNEESKSTIIKTSRVIKPKEYVVIAKDTNIYSIYSGLKNVVISNFPILNNNGGMIVISDSLGRVIDSVYYKSSWGGRNGKSLERIDVNTASQDSVNWQGSKLAKGGTPNKSNSVSRKNFDVAVVSYTIQPEVPIVGENVNLTIDIANYGKSSAEADLIIYEIKSNGREKIRQIKINELLPDTHQQHEIKNFIPKLISKGKFVVALNIINETDEDTTNNSITFTIFPSYAANSILVNEIMYNPINGEPEWIEIYNTTNYDIDLEGWSISDVLINPAKTKIKSGIVYKNSFAVISKDSSIINYHKAVPSELIINQFANLNNDADGVVIKDYYDKTIDSVFYDKSWGGENGKSLERKSLLVSSLEKDNWGSSVDVELSTPGRTNSISRKSYDLAVKDISTEPEIIYENSLVKLIATIVNNGLRTASSFLVQFFYEYENKYINFSREYGNDLVPGDSIKIITSNKLLIKNDIKIFCKVIMNNDEDTLNNYLEKELRISSPAKSILINEIMFNPFEGESEWIEIVNVSNYPINLKNWYVSDLMPSPSKSVITKEDEYLQPYEFAVLTSDTSKFLYNHMGKIFQTKFGTLNNTTDGIIIYDFNGRMIDSVFYNSKWGNKKGYSLERISFAASSTDSTNWSLSLSKDGATPGYENSINNLSTYKKNSIVINEIMYEPEAGNSEFIEFFNTTNDTIQIGGMNLIFGKNGKTKLSDTYLLITPNSFFIIANDSSIYKNYSTLQPDDVVIINNSLSLLNDGCELILKDIKENTIDSVYYLPSWHNKNLLNTKNKSLERINPFLDSNDKTNWSTSVNKEGATPLRQNSIYTAVVNSESKVTISPNPFSPDNDGFEDFTTINFDLSFKISQVRIRVYDSQGRLVRTLTHNMPAASHNSIIFDGLDDNGRPLRIGIYILLIEIASENGNTEVIKRPIVIARKL